MGVSSCCEKWCNICGNIIVIQRWKLIRAFLSSLYNFLLTIYFSGPWKDRVGWVRAMINSSTWNMRRSIKQNDRQRELVLEWTFAWSEHSEILWARQACHSFNLKFINTYILIQVQREKVTWHESVPLAPSVTLQLLEIRALTSPKTIGDCNMAAWLTGGDVNHLITHVYPPTLSHKQLYTKNIFPNLPTKSPQTQSWTVAAS